MSQPLYPLLFYADLHEKMWGGMRLRSMKGLPSAGNPIGESWDISSLAGNPGIVENGPLAGQTLPELVRRYKGVLVGEAVYRKYGDNFPLLVKLLDSESELSIQVHPDDNLAQQRHGCLGKSEMWYVLDAVPGAYIYLGFRKQISPGEFERRAQDGTICEVLNRTEVRKDDVFFIPAGCVHSLGAGLLVAEIQQSSDITYRIFDFGRPRELHLAEAVSAVDYTLSPGIPQARRLLSDGVFRLVDDSHFTIDELCVQGPQRRDLSEYGSFVICLCLQGECLIHTGSDEPASRKVCLPAGRCCLIPACMADHIVEPAAGCSSAKMLECYIGLGSYFRVG